MKQLKLAFPEPIPKLYVVYDPANPYSAACDNYIQTWVDHYIDNLNRNLVGSDFRHITGQELIVLAFRVAVKEGKIDHERIVIVVGEKNYCLDKDGRYKGDAPRMASVMDDLLGRLL